MSAKIGSLNVDLTLSSARFQQGLKRSEAQLKGFQGKMAAIGGSMKGLGVAFAGGAIASGLSSIASNAFEMASALSEAAAQTGLSVEALQSLRYAAEQSGVGADKMDATIKKLNRSLGDLQLGKKSVVDAFAQIGLSADDLRGKRPEVALRMIFDGLNKLPDVQQRVAVGSVLMSRGFSDLLPMVEAGSAGLDKFAEASKKNGEISSEDAAKLDELADSWGRLKTRVGVVSATLIANVAEMGGKVGAFFDRVNAGAAAIDAALLKFANNAVGSIRNMVVGIQQWITGKLSAIWDGAVAKVDQFRKAVRDMYISVVGGSDVPDMVDGIGHHVARLDGNMVRPIQAATGKVSAAFAQMSGFSGALAGMTPGQGVAGALDAISESANDNADEAETATGRIARTFSEMADSVTGAMQGLANSLKHGGFLDILSAVVGLGLQLGGIGAFGKKIAGRINAPKIPGYANGTNFHPGGLALVGERGPELVNMNRGAQVFSNADLKSMGRGGSPTIIINAKDAVLTHQVRQWVAEGMAVAADAGADMGVSRMNYRNTRRVA